MRRGGSRARAASSRFVDRDWVFRVLRDVLLRHRGVPIIIEMKVDSEAMAAGVADDIRAAGAEDTVCCAGYGGTSAALVRRLLPGVATSACHAEVRLAVYRSWSGWPVKRPPFGGYQVPEHAGRVRIVSPRFIRHAHAAGLEVQVWTVDTEADMERFLAWGVDALISNRPDLAVTVRDTFVGTVAAARGARVMRFMLRFVACVGNRGA